MENKEIIFSPSFLASDFSNPIVGLREIEEAGCNFVHLDIMDGNFVPQITFGSKFVSDLRKRTDLVFDVHLMVNRPEDHIKAFLDAGANIITIHAEATTHIDRVVNMIREGGAEAGVALCPASSVSQVEAILPILDYVLVMTVNPGYGGQRFIPYTLEKIEKLTEIRSLNNYSFRIAADGGIGKDNIKDLYEAGCNLFVMGTSFFKEPNKEQFISELNEVLMENY